MLEALIVGISFGFIAGISPGPLLTLVISETLKYNYKEGIKVALTPLFTDAPIMLFSLFIAFRLKEIDTILGIISLSGALFILYLGIENIRTKAIEVSQNANKTFSYRKGIIANFLSPHPYLFWLLVGAPFVLKTHEKNSFAPYLFIAGFYILIVGVKIVIALLSEKSKNILAGKFYILTVRTLGIILLIFSIILLKDGLEFLKIIH